MLPSVASSLGVPGHRDAAVFDLPQAARAVVVLVDGLGHDLLDRARGHAPFLRRHLGTARRVPCGFPTTTATSMGTFGTGLPPGSHGLVGMQVLDPDRDVLVNELSWEDGPDPRLWQPHSTVFESATDDGVEVTMIGPDYFDGSGLTTAALRGARFAAARALDARVDAAADAVRRGRRSLVYLYWGDLDKIGHVHGCESTEWTDHLEMVDGALARLAARLPSDTTLVVTADHGMVDIPHGARVDLLDRPDLMAGVRHLGGEPRCLQLYTESGALADVAAAWTAALAGRAKVLTRDQLVDEGWLGPVEPRVAPRIGDLVVVMGDGFAVVHSGLMRPELVRLLGLHGSGSDAELAVPVLVVPGAGGV